MFIFGCTIIKFRIKSNDQIEEEMDTDFYDVVIMNVAHFYDFMLLFPIFTKTYFFFFLLFGMRDFYRNVRGRIKE